MSVTYLNTDSGTARIIQITDTHIGADGGFLFNGTDTLASLKRILDAILSSERPDAVLVTGDLVHDPVATAYLLLMEQLQRLGVPVFCLPGNHDDPLIMEQVMNDDNVSTCKIVAVNQWVVLMVNSYLDGTHSGRLDESEIQWLQKQLRAFDGHPVLIALHHHPVPVNSPWMDAMMLENPQPLMRLLHSSADIRAVIWGHIHQNFETLREGVHLWGCPSTCVQFRPLAKVFEEDLRAPGYRLIQLAGQSQITSEIIRITY